MKIVDKKKIKIIKILSEYEVVINAGSDDGIEVNQHFNILDDEKRLLTDPDTGDILDEFTGYKAELIVKRVEKKYAICRTPRSSSDSISLLAQSMSLGLTKSQQEKLNVSEYDIDNIFSKYTNSIVKIGDLLEKEE